MKLNQVLVVYKYSAYQMHERGLRAPHLPELYALNREKAKALRRHHDEHITAKNEIEKVLREFNIRYTFMDRIELTKPVSGYNLVITIGGDGTVLRSSHFIDDTPVLGVNSFPDESTGFFCSATKDNFKDFIEKIIDDDIKPKPISRLQINLNGRAVKQHPLNEALFASELVAETSKYIIKVGDKSEEQRSSGVWISSAAGSTAVIKSAGGTPLPITSNKLQYLVREPYLGKQTRKYKISNGFVTPPKTIKIISEISNGHVYIDGAKIGYHAPIGTEIEIGTSTKPIYLFL